MIRAFKFAVLAAIFALSVAPFAFGHRRSATNVAASSGGAGAPEYMLFGGWFNTSITDAAGGVQTGYRMPAGESFTITGGVYTGQPFNIGTGVLGYTINDVTAATSCVVTVPCEDVDVASTSVNSHRMTASGDCSIEAGHALEAEFEVTCNGAGSVSVKTMFVVGTWD